MDYHVKIEDFEGPIDLLLFFIQRDKLNIYDIPIAHITKEFLDYMKMMDMMNIDLGGEFVYMAALLMKIKSRMLLPDSDEDDKQAEDPRTPLVQRLLEYQQYKKVSGDLQEKYVIHSVHYPIGKAMSYGKQNIKIDGSLNDTTLISLSSIFQEIINRLPDASTYEVDEEPVNLEEQISFIKETINTVKRIHFNDLISVLKTRLALVVTFIAILEMLRTKQIVVQQDKPFGELILIGESST